MAFLSPPNGCKNSLFEEIFFIWFLTFMNFSFVDGFLGVILNKKELFILNQQTVADLHISLQKTTIIQNNNIIYKKLINNIIYKIKKINKIK